MNDPGRSKWVRRKSWCAAALMGWALAGVPAPAGATVCDDVNALRQRGLSVSRINQVTGLTPAQIRSCQAGRQSGLNAIVGPPPIGAAGPPPIGAAGPAPHGAAGPAPHGAAGPAPHGAAGPAPHGAAGPAPGAD